MGQEGVNKTEAVNQLVMRGIAFSESQDRVLEARSKETGYMSILAVLILKEIIHSDKVFEGIDFEELKKKSLHIGRSWGFEIDPDLIKIVMEESEE